MITVTFMTDLSVQYFAIPIKKGNFFQQSSEQSLLEFHTPCFFENPVMYVLVSKAPHQSMVSDSDCAC